MKSKQIARIGAACAACGACVKVCPRGALSIDRGLRARVDAARCVGCGTCAKTCPAGEITLITQEAGHAEL